MIVDHSDQALCGSHVIHEDVVNRVREVIPDGGDFYKLANLYKIFADNTRLRILWALSREVMCVCDLAALLGMTKSAISHQLKSLRLADLVRYEKRGKVVYYSLADERVRDIFDGGFEHIRK
ncbi:MAG: metalloregulator ArsR/SmtB family transcription factor [Chitinispirillales bacterium]|nr:metalloregulator ArsR/SmtB family transcription factor [Chitinispirillales bacterium]